ncbi:MAG: cyclopropane-fatty-acyl-phospholipid synthase family protein [Alphaproteobacteria bacterium]|nr:cyclopropane-fatty-acyl-phospholipid synthase family protein [Alphaproteobacteria bacterium]
MALFSPVFERLVETGAVTVIDKSGKPHEFGDGTGRRTVMRLKERSLDWKLLVNPYLYFGEAYTDGGVVFEQGSLYDFLETVGRNAANTRSVSRGPLGRGLTGMRRRIQQHNPLRTARKNVAHHYDLNGRLYDLFLDKDRQYSCAYFGSGNDTLEVAQDSKKRHLAAKLLLQPGQKILDIGSGWGGLALYLAQVAQVDVTGVTLSEEQHKRSNQRAKAMKLDRRVRFHLRDYREDEGHYDRIVSVGMFEHVGARHYGEYFDKVRTLLKDDGVFVLHSIGRMEPPGTTNPWLRKYIFPGGYTPSLSETLAAIENAGLWVTDIEILRLHYAETLKEWNRRFQANRAEVAEIYDERFCRMWEFYLQCCEISFRYMNQMVFQIQIAKRQDAVPITRDYITNWERSGGRAGDLAH